MYISFIRAPMDNRYTFKYSERITLVKIKVYYLKMSLRLK